MLRKARTDVDSVLALRFADVHGERVAYRTGGRGPVLLLLHGMAGTSFTWRAVLPALAERFTVVAVDLRGHGESERTRGDYSLGAQANTLRDLLLLLGHERATVIGQSYGGGVALQFAYQFPEWCERIVLVSAGGLGNEVSPFLRALSLPGSETVLAAACAPAIGGMGSFAGRLLRQIGLEPSPGAREIWRSYRSLGERTRRQAFLQTLRSVIDPSGQAVSAANRLYLAEGTPTLIVWGDADPILPVEHAFEAHSEMPGSRLVVFEGVGHFPHCEDPQRFVRVLAEFVESTEAARTVDWQRMADRTRSRNAASPDAPTRAAG